MKLIALTALSALALLAHAHAAPTEIERDASPNPSVADEPVHLVARGCLLPSACGRLWGPVSCEAYCQPFGYQYGLTSTAGCGAGESRCCCTYPTRH